MLRDLATKLPERLMDGSTWSIRGVVCVRRAVYPLPKDTKVISKIFEIQVKPYIEQLAKEIGASVVPAAHQNHYPDFSIILDDGEKEIVAVDIKSAYRVSENQVSGMTLGAYTGYFKRRDSQKDITYPYAKYAKHIVLGIIYSWNETPSEGVFDLEQMDRMAPPVKDIVCFAHEKYQIASDRPGSGNTKNIGSLTDIDRLMAGEGLFAELGEQAFNEY